MEDGEILEWASVVEVIATGAHFAVEDIPIL
jgi:hypothetical protein